MVRAWEWITSLLFLSDVSGMSLLRRTIFAMYLNIPSLSPLFKKNVFEILGLRASTGLRLWPVEKGRMEAGWKQGGKQGGKERWVDKKEPEKISSYSQILWQGAEMAGTDPAAGWQVCVSEHLRSWDSEVFPGGAQALSGHNAPSSTSQRGNHNHGQLGASRSVRWTGGVTAYTQKEGMGD